MIRAIIELKEDINDLFPSINEKIVGCAYDPKGSFIGFSHNGKGVVVEKSRINVVGAENLEQANAVMDWLSAILKSD
jgi:hypothetical protein